MIHHYLDRFQNWEALPTQAGLPPSAVAAQVGDLSLFALAVGPPFSSEGRLPQKRKGTGLQENGSPFPEQDLCILSRGGKMARLAITCNSHRRAKPTIEEKRRGVNQS